MGTDSRARKWARSWLRTDLVGITATVALAAAVAISGALYLAVGKWAGLFAGKLLFAGLLGGLILLVIRRGGRERESTDGVLAAPVDGARHVLVVANEGLESDALCDRVCGTRADGVADAMIVAPVAGSTAMQRLADDVDGELVRAQGRIDTALRTLASRGVHADGRADVADPMTAVLDGLREFPATEVVMLQGGERGWRDAGRVASRVQRELGLPVTEVEALA